MKSEYLSQTYYSHPCAELNSGEGAVNLYGMASFLVSLGYCAHRETKDNGDAPRLRVKELLGAWLTEEKEQQLFLRHEPTLSAVTEEIAKLYGSI
jgi:hypothetical protein